ncbi:MAG: SHOCT domain-containing protein [Planctomycetes bacterium]|nr:SHOCT domain-containing protein [Planctomycetota bacterium]
MERPTLLASIAQFFTENKEVTIGARHPVFESWIAQNLAREEKIVARCYSKDETLVATTEKVLLLKKGSAKAAVSSTGRGAAVGGAVGGLAGMMIGAVLDHTVGAQGVIAKTVDYYNLTSVDCTKGMLFGHMEFTFPGASEIRRGGFSDNAASENVFQFAGDLYDFMVQVTNEIRRRMKLARQPQTVVVQASPGPVAPPDFPGQIRKLAELRDVGILTEEEFQTKKKELLAKM